METIGKVLSLTLLTIFGSAAATIYLVDSNVMPSIFGKQTPVYTSDKNEEQEVNTDFYTIPERRDIESERYAYTVVEEKTGDTGEYNNVKPIWGQAYDTNPVTAERAREIARLNSRDSIIRNLNYWNDRYSIAQREGDQSAAQSALRNYTEYKEALEIKQSSDR